jgi:pyruvate formate lyase activating enzyme
MKYFQYHDEEYIICLLCKHYCKIKKDQHGICGVNYNTDAKLFNSTYFHPSAIHIDPIEKKPLYHFLPSSNSLSLGSVGCNFRCPFCQNHEISQTTKIDKSINYLPQEIVNLAIEYKTQSISYTYNEPTIWYPYIKDIGVIAKKEGIKNIFVSSGYESFEVLEDMNSWVDAANIDLKSFSHDYYKKVLKTDLDGVLESLITLKQSDIWLEITTLIIPEINDSEKEIHQMAEFIASKIGVDTPWHLSAFHPSYKMMDTPKTNIKSLLLAREIAYSYGIKYVYIGNVPNDNSTYCPNCKTKLIDRLGFNANDKSIVDSRCCVCNEYISGVWE